ncbi:MAG: nodulation protein NfeD [Bacteroidales bacterium]|nr:nodulation protein NfeD [Bacteroidales bacterium]
MTKIRKKQLLRSLKAFAITAPAVLLLSSLSFRQADLQGQQGNDTTVVYVFDILKEIARPAWRTTLRAFAEARALEADYIIMRINTYGGLVDIADSIRTKIINSPVPVLGFIDNQAISAGALISIACDSIYMRPGGNIGAATVVDQTGAVVPDKYQSFMRSTMRATAESHGKDTIITGNDTIIRWHRDPLIAEAMVDPTIMVPGIVDSTKVLTFTAEEAMRNGYCEGLAVDIPEVLEKAGIRNYKLSAYVPSTMDKFIGFLISPVVQGILIIVMIGGIYFELQSPGIGFPIAAAAIAALLYFAPLYVEGLAEHWEILLFVVGIVLVILEIFVIPGFGIAGISGITLIVAGLTLSLVNNVVFRFEGINALAQLSKALFTVLLSVFISFALVILGTKRFAFSKAMRGLALDSVQDHREGYIGVDVRQKEMIGRTGTAYTILRPSGLVEIDNEIFDAKAEIGYIEKGEKVKVIRDETGQLYVIKA